MAFEPEFVRALSNKRIKIIDRTDLYKCFYCKQIYARNETASMKECRYHGHDCMCSDPHKSYSRCCRLPYHSEVELDIAKQPYQ